MAFFNTFFKTLGILLGFTTFLIIINITIFYFQKNNFSFNLTEGDEQSKNIIAILNLNGPIIKNINHSVFGKIINYIDPELVSESLKELQNFKPKILIIRVNSPGGTVSATSSLENKINDFKKLNNTKIYFYTDEILASGGYWISTTGERTYANYGSIIGSIGVSGPSWYYYNQPKSISRSLFGQVIETEKGIEVFNQNAGASKDLFNPFRKPTNQELNHLQNMVKEIYVEFISKVSKNRKIEKNTLVDEIGALIFTSSQAKKNFLIDGVIEFDDLIDQIIIEENFKNYKIIKKNTNENLLNNYLSSFINNNKTTVCNELNSSFSSVFPIYLNNC